MRHTLPFALVPFLALASLPFLVPTAACSNSACGGQYNCPEAVHEAQVEIDLPCGATLSKMALSGVCTATGPSTFASTQGGSCHVAVTLTDGTSESADVTFLAEDLGCCGSSISAQGLPYSTLVTTQVLTIAGGCTSDAGPTPDAAPADASPGPDAADAHGD